MNYLVPNKTDFVIQSNINDLYNSILEIYINILLINNNKRM